MSRKRSNKSLNDSPRRWKDILKKYGLTKDQYNTILQEQDGRCFICLRTPEEIRRKQNLSVDHRHRDGQIRGLLCYNCNHKLLPSVKEDPEFVERIRVYLSRSTNYGKVPQ